MGGFDSKQDGFNLTAWTDSPWVIQEDGKSVDVYNSARKGSVEGDETGAGGFGPLKDVIDDPSDPSKLSVGPPFLPSTAYGDYWVLDAGPTNEAYEWGIVSGGPPKNKGEEGGCVAGSQQEVNGAGLWLFTKDPQPPSDVVDMLRNKTSALGFDLSVLVPVEHEGCVYPDN